MEIKNTSLGGLWRAYSDSMVYITSSGNTGLKMRDLSQQRIFLENKNQAKYILAITFDDVLKKWTYIFREYFRLPRNHTTHSYASKTSMEN